MAYALCRSKLAEVVEKGFKAELIRTGWFLEKTHDPERLLGLLQARHSHLAPLAETLCDALAEVYFSGRYPGFEMEDVDWDALARQIDQATDLLRKVRASL